MTATAETTTLLPGRTAACRLCGAPVPLPADRDMPASLIWWTLPPDQWADRAAYEAVQVTLGERTPVAALPPDVAYACCPPGPDGYAACLGRAGITVRKPVTDGAGRLIGFEAEPARAREEDAPPPVVVNAALAALAVPLEPEPVLEPPLEPLPADDADEARTAALDRFDRAHDAQDAAEAQAEAPLEPAGEAT